MTTAPEQNRDVKALRPDMRAHWLKWQAAANEAMDPYTVHITETHRTQERQQWLWNHGRVDGFGVEGRLITWTLDSNHKYHIAIDFHLQLYGQAKWGEDLYLALLSKVPPEEYGLESLAPAEFVHLQIKNAIKVRSDWTPAQEVQMQQPTTRAHKVFVDGKMILKTPLPNTHDVLQRFDTEGNLITSIRPKGT